MVAGLQKQQPTDVEAAFFGHPSKRLGVLQGVGSEPPGGVGVS